MFYRARFDSFVGAILKNTGRDTDASLTFWPMEATPLWVARGQEVGIRPVEAAAFGVCDVAGKRWKAGQLSEAEYRFIAQVALAVARENSASAKTLAALEAIAFG